jgi:hypothetical protein
MPLKKPYRPHQGPETDFPILHGLSHAERTVAKFTKQRGSNEAARDGLRYERKVGKELLRLTQAGCFNGLEHNPWFEFRIPAGLYSCSPDYILWSGDDAVVVEIKLTWVPIALRKLNDFYCPIIEKALGVKTIPLVICRNLTPAAPPSAITLRAALTGEHKLFHWAEVGQVLWV